MQKEFIGSKKTGNEYRQPAYAIQFYFSGTKLLREQFTYFVLYWDGLSVRQQ